MESGHRQNPSSQQLDVPSNTAKSIRKELLVEKLLNPPKCSLQTSSERSTILDQVKAFVPKLRNANEELERLEDRSAICIDSPEEGEPYVEMNLQMFADASGTSDSDSDSTSSTVSSDSSSDEDSASEKEAVPTKQRKLISELD